ncbi:hypothetical protein FPV67DRAFT_628950 [Lyophyllum atratum]|nr:hypothetical protein FPV67DRAFT_628950 [Lyophyllum atratum]
MAPALTEVSLLNFPSRSLMPVLPWGQVTRFRGHHLDLADFLDVLPCLPLLETCTVSWAIGYPPVCDPIVHTNLHTLTVEGSVSVLKHLTLPALESLRIKTRRAFTGQQCVQLLLRSGCQLTSLYICVNFISATTLIECLEAAPTLRELQVLNRKDRIHSVFNNFLIERLTLRGGKLDLVPRLRRLEVLSCSCQFDVEVLGEMLSSRGGSTSFGNGRSKGRGKGDLGGRLECFWLEASSGCALKVWEDVMYSPRIWGLMEQGMTIRVIV